jgi:hypothetical protein
MARHILSPRFTPHEAREKMGDSEKWKNFALRAQHHPVMKQQLMIIQGGKCPVCQMPVCHTDTIHHVSYLARCRTDETVVFATPTEKRPHRTSEAPPCEHCPEQARCLRLLVLVHDRCHFIIHKD